MSPTFDFSSLLCEVEEDDYIVSDLTWQHQSRRLRSEVEDLDGADSVTVLPIQNDEYILVMVKKEVEHLPESDYLKRLKNGDFDLIYRLEVIDWISQDRVLSCIEMINEQGQSGNLTPSARYSPIGVLDSTYLSYKSNESPVGSCDNSP